MLPAHSTQSSYTGLSSTVGPVTAANAVEVDRAEILRLAAEDGGFYSRYFFPQTFRQESPAFHLDMWHGLESPDYRYFGAEVFRGGAKTTIARTVLSKRIAYGLTRTAVFISASQSHAKRSLRWLKQQIERQTPWARFFQLTQGDKWTDEEIKIRHGIYGHEVWVLAMGITGQVRGINLDDFRPDFIVVDDPNDEENTGTEEQREKMSQLFFGSLQNGLTPASENEYAKMILLQTPLNKGDLIDQCKSSPNWHVVTYPCFQQDPERGEVSAWEERFPTDFLRKEREAYIQRGQLYMWLREMECRIVAPEGAAFNVEHLRYYEHAPAALRTYIAVDPARSKLKHAHKTAIAVIGLSPTNDTYVLETWAQSGKNPEETWQQFYEMAMRWRPLMVGVESVAYQQMLAWYFQQKMRELNFFVPIREIDDRRKKADRIRQAISGRLTGGTLYVNKKNSDLVRALADYRDGIDIDILDALAMAIDLTTPFIFDSLAVDEFEDLGYISEKDIPSLPFKREALCP